METIDWIYDNREWLFSGIGISVLTVIGVGIRKLLKKKEKSNDNSKILIKQVNKGTNNTQIGVQNNYYTKE